MSKLNEVIDSLTNENVDEVKEQLTSEATTLEKNNSQLYKRAKKAEGFTYDKGTNKWTKEEKKPDAPTADNKTKEPNGLDYGHKAYCRTKGIKTKEEFEYIENIMEKSGESLEDTLDDSYVMNKLDGIRAKKTTKDAIPSSSKRSSKSGKDSVDFWLAKPFNEVPKGMKQEVLNARIKIDKKNNTGTKNSVIMA